MSRLLDFYRGDATDAEGRRLDEILAWPDDDWEAVHDFIQWLFPLPEPSQFNPDAPLLSAADIEAFRINAGLRAKVAESFRRFLAFAGLTFTADGKVIEADDFTARSGDVWAQPNHNWLRITRVLRSLNLLGLHSAAQSFYDWLVDGYQRRRFPIAGETFAFWTHAVAPAQQSQPSE